MHRKWWNLIRIRTIETGAEPGGGERSLSRRNPTHRRIPAAKATRSSANTA